VTSRLAAYSTTLQFYHFVKTTSAGAIIIGIVGKGKGKSVACGS